MSIILSEVSQDQKAKGLMFSLGPIKYKQYDEKQVTVRGGH
jgi:hypothetical protein